MARGVSCGSSAGREQVRSSGVGGTRGATPGSALAETWRSGMGTVWSMSYLPWRQSTERGNVKVSNDQRPWQTPWPLEPMPPKGSEWFMCCMTQSLMRTEPL